MQLTLRQAEAGDTIVEVLIAMSVIVTVLVAAFSITSRNTASLQANAERIQAQHIAASQIESLKSNNGIVTPGNCYVNNIETAACSSITASGSGAKYTTAITGPSGLNPVAVPATYTVTITWSGLTDKT